MGVAYHVKSANGQMLTKDMRDELRDRARVMLTQGFGSNAVATRLGVSERTICRWRKDWAL